MRKKIISIITLSFWLMSTILTTVPYASAQGWQELASDIDGDGLLNDLETAGWYNQSGGPFVTNPLDADSDDDGLTDGEEKVFDTNPLDSTSPGLYVRYKNEYSTKEYFRTKAQNPADPFIPSRGAYLEMKQAGNRLLMTEAMVTRRGSTLHIGGPISGTLSLTGNGLNPLTPQKDVYSGGWNVTLPPASNGTTGTYIATLSLAGQDPITMPLHVIFELPTSELTPAEIDAFLYNDDPSDPRDETAVVWRTRRTGNYQDEGYTYIRASGWSQAFWTDQYKKYVFVDQVMPRIQGLTNQNDATEALSNGADTEVRVDYNNFVKFSMEDTLYKYDDGIGLTQDGEPCQNQAGAFTGFLRSAGIPASPFIVDWKNLSADDDHSVKMWFDGQWNAGRSYSGGEHGNNTYKYYPFDNGITADIILDAWDNRGGYNEHKGDVLMTINENWNFEQWRIKGPSETCTLGEDNDGLHCFEGGTVNAIEGPVDNTLTWGPDKYMINQSRDYRWDSRKPLQMREMNPHATSISALIWESNPWLPTDPPWPDAYEIQEHPNYPIGPFSQNWPIEPIPQDCPAGYLGICPFGVGSLAASDFEDETDIPVTPLTYSDSETSSTLVQVNGILDEYGVDTDGNGRFDKLIVDLSVTAHQAGHYTFNGKLFIPEGVTRYGGIFADNNIIYLPEGTYLVQLEFDGLAIGNANANGPFTLTDLWISDIPNFDPRLWDNILVAVQPNVETQPYNVDQFERNGAALADTYSHFGLDNDGDGRYEAVTVNVSLDTIVAGSNYRLEGDLFDGLGNFIGRSSWTGSGAVGVLTFELTQTTAPYTLKNLRLYESSGRILDSRSHNVYTITDLGGQVDQGIATMDFYTPVANNGLGAMGTTITPTLVFTHAGIDTNSNGFFDRLDVGVQVDISQVGQYRVEGWLADSSGNLITYGNSQPVTLGVGTGTLVLPFDGNAINGYGANGPYTIISLRILDGSSYGVLDEVNLTGASLSYNASQFEPDSVATIFSDDMESGTAQWTSQAPWSHTTKLWPHSTQLWEGSASGSQNGSLTSVNMNLSNYASPLLRFENTYHMASGGDTGYVEASTNGVNWTKVATYTNNTQLKETAVIALTGYGESSNLKLRFKAASSNNLVWDIDNVHVNGWPAVTDAGFTYTSVSTSHMFTATYSSIDTTLPVTYSWNFGDGSPVQTTNSPYISHNFPSNNDYTVQLTVENPYDNHAAEQVVGVGEPVTSTSFNYTPTVPEVNMVISFNASYGPVDATNTVTNPVVYKWDFGDGSPVVTSTNPLTTHTYTAGGSYPVKLTTSNGFGTATQTQVVEVKEGVSDVGFTTLGTLIEDDLVTFQTQITPTTAAQPVTYTWSFGDGSSTIVTTNSTIQHTFDAPATYTVWVTAENGYGGTQGVYNNAVVITGRPVLTTAFTYLQTQNNYDDSPFKATFNASYGPANATQPVTYFWNFGDGSSVQTTQNASIEHQFPSNSTYTVLLTTTNGYGSPVTDSQTIELPFDNDGDGLPNAQEWILGTDPDNPDSDGDGSPDGQEVNGYTYTGYPPHGDYNTTVTTNPLEADSDGDGLSDGDELALGTHPGDPDTDGDGLSDGEEPGGQGVPNPLDPDSDDDGLSDGEEVNTYETNPLSGDSDDDGVPDITEIDAGGTTTAPADTDGDGIINAMDPDDDNDGVSTKDEDRNGNEDPTDDFTEDPDGLIPDYLFRVGGGDVFLPIIMGN